MPTDPVVFTGVSKWYGPVIGLNDVTLTVGPGVTGLLGPNGAGKSTLVRLLTGQVEPSLGRVRLFGRAPFREPRVLARVGCCPDIEALDEEATGHGFLAAAAFLSGFTARAARARAARLLDAVGLAGVAAQRLGAYSKGMRQRLKLAQALVHDPEVLVLDEPLNGMDPVVRRDTIDLVRALGRAGRTVLVSSHVLHEVEAMTDRIVLLHHGRVLAEGRVPEIRDLLEGFPHQVTIESDDPRRLARLLLERFEVAGLKLDGSQLTVEVRDPARVYAALEEVVLDQGLEVARLFTRDDSLEAVFDYLVA